MAQESSNVAKRKNSGGRFRDADPEMPYNPKQVAALETWMRMVLKDEKKEMDAKEFFGSLRDGTRLCELLNHMNHGGIIDDDEIHTREYFEKAKKKATDRQCIHNLIVFTNARDKTYGEYLKHDKRFTHRHLIARPEHQDLNFVVQSLYALALIMCRIHSKARQANFPVIDQTHFQDASAEADDSEDECKDDSQPNPPNNNSNRPRAKKASKKNVKDPHISGPPALPQDHGDVKAQKQRKLRQRAAAFQPDDAEDL